jgi:MFS superfamily sulfate permease-like transporter
MFRFNAPLVFFNAPGFKREAVAAADAAGPGLKWFVIDMLPVTGIDATGIYAMREVVETLRARGITFACAGRKTEWQHWSQRHGFAGRAPSIPTFATLPQAVRAFRDEFRTEYRAAGEEAAGNW